MARRTRIGPLVIGSLIVLALAAAVIIALRKPAVPVDLGEVTRGPMAVTIDDEAETRAHDVYIVSAPVTGRLMRVEADPGDRVVAGRTVVARLVPAAPGFLDARTVSELRARVEALADGASAAAARVREARAQRELAVADFARQQEIFRRGFLPKASLDRSRMARDSAVATVAEAERSAASAAHSLAAARASLAQPGSRNGGGGVVPVTAPVNGWVLRVPQKSEATVIAGTPLVEIGDPGGLEIVTDLLSADAVKVAPGAEAVLDQWGGDLPIRARVRRVEPYGFTKVSALGVEEQRVNVILDFTGPPEERARLGHGYRGIVRIITWSRNDALTVPASALFRDGNKWALFLVEGGRARLKQVRLGHTNADRAELLTPLATGARVVVHPGDRVEDGVRVRERGD